MECGVGGGEVVQVGGELKSDSSIEIDFKPDLTDEELRKKWRNDVTLQEGAAKYWRLSSAAIALIEETMKPNDFKSLLAWWRHCQLQLTQPRPSNDTIP